MLLGCPLSIQPRLSDRLMSTFGARKKANGDRYLIVLTDQFRKDSLCSFVEAEFPECSVITVSGSIRKCKSAAMDLR